ncbi:MAG TPA: isoprenylcysteine carboxylmethyltransferase family protein [Stellaceae bacterium]|nr:isoprenylcysteine carboxylmethyltransferase family protein [Stellaceae bacterium]
MTFAQIILGLVALQRLGELVLALRNTRRLLARGAVEVGRSHYPALVLLHGAWLATLALTLPRDATISWPLLALFLVLQGLRVWVIWSLGPFWTTRIITLPHAPLVRRGPYRFVRHPNYMIVAAEIAVLPLVFGAWQVALAFSLLNAVILAWRIRVEEQVLRHRRTLA